MGKWFLVHPGGRRLYTCQRCCNVLTNRENLLSTGFRGQSGDAYLFKKVDNIKVGDTRTTDMMTGVHIVRDVYCIRCSRYLGWTYEFATVPQQRYKEGRYVLECRYIKEQVSNVMEDSTL